MTTVYTILWALLGLGYTRLWVVVYVHVCFLGCIHAEQTCRHMCCLDVCILACRGPCPHGLTSWFLEYGPRFDTSFLCSLHPHARSLAQTGMVNQGEWGRCWTLCQPRWVLLVAPCVPCLWLPFGHSAATHRTVSETLEDPGLVELFILTVTSLPLIVGPRFNH